MEVLIMKIGFKLGNVFLISFLTIITLINSVNAANNIAFWADIENEETKINVVTLESNGSSKVLRFKAEVPDGKTLGAYKFIINYDSSLASVTAVKTSGSVFPPTALNTNTQGTILFNGFSADGVAGPVIISFIDVTFTGLQEGTFNVSTTVDNFGADPDNQFMPTPEILAITIEKDETCNAKAAFSQTQESNSLVVNFDATASVGQSFIWDFGDGTTGSGVSISHEYASSGTFTVKLTVTGDTANCSDEKIVDITVYPIDNPPFNAAFWTEPSSDTHETSIQIKTGAQKTLQFQAEVPDGKTLGAYKFIINYDSSLASVTAVKTSGSVFPPTALNTNTPGTILFNGFSADGVAGPVIISFIDVTFTGLQDGTFNVSTTVDNFGADPDNQFIPTPEILAIFVLDEFQYHSADYTPKDQAINLSELLRVIQFYNFDKQGGGGAYHCDTRETNAYGYEDGFRPGLGPDTDHECTPHSSDYEHEIKHPGRSVTQQPQDWIIDLDELLRLIQIYNSKCATQYEVDSTTEDGFKVLDCN